ncbi:hypothetical protein CHLNCDRAFT_132922 [Chlorella variabilis]|uniref:PPIase cyclophilin-type domain-containing protein n=1 Tax=Chlorella variabilis TaxID=554065 RepID=E1Z1Y5_CHLVA|nr:hypothetical protein CHLNCDRAFT_132922 [Chlorella variabilis]EFN59900.1 hypothetical protein CHLNCDRAFT_132922 [Chlorella variabilis]|eukprot:XP_005852002.1 hypothetical protein CHLNCDRAFT_132922 [Chlorella variabilis]
MLANTQAAAPAAAGLPAGQRCFVSHQQHIQRQHRPRLAAAAARGPVAAAAAAAQVLPSCGGRRQLLLAAGLLAAGPAVSWQVAAEEAAGSSRQVFFDITVDRKPLGRIVPQDAPAIGGQRFLDLAQGKEGVAFRKTKFELLEDGFIQNSGLKALSYQASGRTAITGGLDTELLEEELAAQQRRGGTVHGAPGLVSFLVKPRIEIVSKDKLVASKGKLITVTETFGEIPNGSSWAITTEAVPELDDTHLVVGRVVQGMDVVRAVAALPRVKDNTNSPFFQYGKATGDKRADVAQRAFKKAFNKIVVDECGYL